MADDTPKARRQPGRLRKAASAAGGTVRGVTEAAGGAVGGGARTTRRTARKAVDATAAAAGAAGAVALKPVTLTGDAAGFAFTQMQALYDKGVDTAFPECPVSAFMLPTGPEPDDYLLTFDLDEFLANLQTGVFVRPKIELWAAHAKGHDTQRLAGELAARFAEELAASMERTQKEGETAVAERQVRESEQLSELGREFWGNTVRDVGIWTAAVSAGAGVVAIAPVGLAGAVLFPAVLLAVGVRPKTTIFGAIGNYISSRSDRATAEKNLAAEVKQLEREFKRKRKAFERAVGRLAVREHPGLRSAAAALPALDKPAAQEPPGPIVDALPDVSRFLARPDYRDTLAIAQGRPIAGEDAAASAEGGGAPASSNGSGIGGFFRGIFGSGKAP